MAAKPVPKRNLAKSEMDPAFADIVEAFRRDKNITIARMFGSEGLKTNGKVFVMLVKGDLVAKLPKERVTALISTGVGEHFDPGHGRAMKEWVALNPKERINWLKLAKEAQKYVSSMS